MQADLVIDAQWGSTGKGKLCGYLAQRNVYDAVVCEFGPNSGHSYVDDDNRRFVFKALPVGSLFIRDVYLSPDCVIDIPQLELEMEMVKQYRMAEMNHSMRLHIHPHAAVVTANAIQAERESLQRISSTLRGAGAARGFKAMRGPAALLAKDVPSLVEFIDYDWERSLANQYLVLAESSQGFDLSLNWGHEYPYVTGRDITVASSCNAMGIHPNDLREVWGSVRTFPIRVGNVIYNDPSGQRQEGSSGPCYGDQQEKAWSDIGVDPEMTTVTGKVRRVFTFSVDQMARFCYMNRPTSLFLNFVNYLPGGLVDWREWIRKMEADVEARIGYRYNHKFEPVVTLCGIGPADSEVYYP